jgi:hypothetical protein
MGWTPKMQSFTRSYQVVPNSELNRQNERHRLSCSSHASTEIFDIAASPDRCAKS